MPTGVKALGNAIQLQFFKYSRLMVEVSVLSFYTWQIFEVCYIVLKTGASYVLLISPISKH